MSDLVKALEDLLEEPVHCTRCGYYGHFVSLDPVQSPCGRCDELKATVERARKALDAVPVLEWERHDDKKWSASVPGWYLEVGNWGTGETPYGWNFEHGQSIDEHGLSCASHWVLLEEGDAKTLAQAKRRAAAALRKEGVVFRTVRK